MIPSTSTRLNRFRPQQRDRRQGQQDQRGFAAENEGIAALQPHDALAGFRGLDHAVDGVLPDAGLADAAADRHARGVAADAVENFRRDQFVIKHDVGILERAQRLDGEQIRIARPGADQRDRPSTLSGRRAQCGRIGDRLDRGFGLVLAARENRRADRAVDDALPEAAAQRKLGNARR